MENNFDVIIIGGGPAGYACAIRCAQLHMKVACIDLRPNLGGVCLNEGCIPSKTLLNSSYLYWQARTQFLSQGIDGSDGLSVSISNMMHNKQQVINDLAKGIDALFNKYKVVRFYGTAEILTHSSVKISFPDGDKIYSANHIVIATGSQSAEIPGIPIDEVSILSSKGVLELQKIPKHLVIVGAGYIGLEMACLWNGLGTLVTVIDSSRKLLGNMDFAVGAEVERILVKQGINILLGCNLREIMTHNGGLEVVYDSQVGGKGGSIDCDKALIAIGRRPCTGSLGLENLSIVQDKRGCIRVDENFMTTTPNVYAVGDVIAGQMLAHKAQSEGVALAQYLSGHKTKINYDALPSVMYLWPEVAVVGITEQILQDQLRAYKIGMCKFKTNSRSKCSGHIDGFVKILTDAHTDEILGCHIIGPEAGSIIQQVALIMEYKGCADDLVAICQSHPGYSEALKEAALDSMGMALHK